MKILLKKDRLEDRVEIYKCNKERCGSFERVSRMDVIRLCIEKTGGKLV